MSRNIGLELKKIRKQRSLSLDDVAKATDVSKAQLAQIEKGEANPTVSTIWKIAAGLKISFSSLLQPPTISFQKYDGNTATYVSEENGKYRVYSIIPYDPERGWELYKIEMDAGVIHKSEAHTDGVEETIIVISGEVIIECCGMKEKLHAGESLIFSANQPHQYENPTDEVTVIHLIIQYR